MKKITSYITVLALLFGLTSCEKQTTAEDNYKDTADIFVYDKIDYNAPTAMAAGNGAELYLAETENGKTVITRYDENGEALKEYPVDCSNIYDMFYSEGAVYIGTDGSVCAAVDKLDTETGETERICEFPNLSDIRNLSAYGGEITAIGKDKTKKGIECNYYINGYSQAQYPERGIYSFKEGNITEIVTDFPFEAAGFGGSVIIYGCNDTNGFYFRQYKDNSLSEPKYTDQIGVMRAFCAFGEEEYITSSTSVFSVDKITAGNISDRGGSDIMPNVFIFNIGRRELKANDGFCWYLDNNKNALIRIKLSTYYKGNTEITLICSNLSYFPPFSCGYNIRKLRPGQEETALKILAHDKDFDICYLSSRDDISGNIRDKGSFYPLNEIEGIAEYIDGLFPNIKEACTNEDGEIWCIPVTAEVPSLIYNDEKCKELGFDLSNITLEGYLDFLDNVKSNGRLRRGSGFSAYTYTEAYLMKYLSENNSFDTPEFRETAALLAERFSYSTTGNTDNNNYMNSSIAAAAAFEDNYGDFVADMRNDGDYYINSSVLKSAPVPFPTEGSPISLIFMCVNPDSAHLEDTLDYVSSLAQYVKSQKNVFLFTDKAAYSDNELSKGLYEIYSGGKVTFAYSGEIYHSDFERFLGGEITIDEFISEADRKLSAYLNE